MTATAALSSAMGFFGFMPSEATHPEFRGRGDPNISIRCPR